jgi:hypothetical protein
MKVKLDEKVILDISDTMLKVLADDINDEIVSDIERRLVWIITSKYVACINRLQAKWDPILSSRGIEMIPTNKEKYAELVFSQPDYKAYKED